MSTRRSLRATSSIAPALGFATAVEAAEFLRLSKAMLHKLVCDGKVPARRYGRVVRIPWSWLRDQAQTGEN
jgi:excisionase family DNA binding protein